MKDTTVRLLCALAFLLLLVVLWSATVGCSTVPIHKRLANGAFEDGYETYALGILLRRRTEIIPAPEEAEAIAKAKAAEAEGMAKAKALTAKLMAPSQQQSRANWLWLGAAGLCLLLSVTSVVLAVVFDGWKRFGIAAAVFLVAGAAFTGVAGLARWLWIGPAAIGGAGILLVVAYLFRHYKLFDARKVVKP